MADSSSYPQIPTTVWWGIRSILQRTPSATIDERFLGVQLGVQEAAARQYLKELQKVGILTDQGKATHLANRWRHDETYWEAAQEILKSTYPDGLLQVAPPGEADRQRVVSWFTREGLGSGSANNRAATYLLISSPSPNEAPPRSTSTPRPKGEVERATGTSKPSGASVFKGRARQNATARHEPMPLNVNVQIHIGADATNEQIESIFAAMRRYLYADSAS
jgi:hypothetical protein